MCPFETTSRSKPFHVAKVEALYKADIRYLAALLVVSSKVIWLYNFVASLRGASKQQLLIAISKILTSLSLYATEYLLSIAEDASSINY